MAKFDGTVIQTNHYYSYGMSLAEGTFAERQPYKYNGKELDTENGLNLYDYNARQMEVVAGRFTSVDPMAEKYYAISPYIYCLGNPVKYIDPNGEDTYLIIYGSGWLSPGIRNKNNDVNDSFRISAEAKKTEIENASYFTENDKVEIVYAATEDDYMNAINAEYSSGKIASMNVYAHGSNNSINLGGPENGSVELSPANADYRLVSAYKSAQNPDGNNEIQRINVQNFTDNTQVSFWGCNIGGYNKGDLSHAQSMADHMGENRTIRAFVGDGGAEFKTKNGKIIYDGTMIRSADRKTQQVKLSTSKPH